MTPFIDMSESKKVPHKKAKHIMWIGIWLGGYEVATTISYQFYKDLNQYYMSINDNEHKCFQCTKEDVEKFEL